MITKFKIFENYYDVQNYKYLNLEQLENGDLKISLNNDGITEVDDYGIDEIKFYNFFEDIQGNSDYIYFDNLGESGLGLSDAPCITDGYYIDDNAEMSNDRNDDSEIFIHYNYVTTD